jgi:3-oxoacyl-[acyl-carrier protein] reductase
MKLAGKTALITGAGTGIGRAVAERFAAEGARVVIADRDRAAAEQVASALGTDVARAAVIDIADEAQVAAAFAELENDSWSPNVVVANAGIQMFGHDAKIAELELSVWQQTLNVNLTGTFLTVKYAVQAMLQHGGGSIIFTGSPTALNGEGASFTAYSSSKAGMHGMARAVAGAYARDGIRVNTVVPGYTETSLVSAIINNDADRAAIISRIPVGRAGAPSDVEGIMVYLASDDSAFATGATFTVDGGMTTL